MSDALPSSAGLAWLANMYAYANKPDQNLGRGELGASLCRITKGSAEAIMAAFSELDARYFGMARTFVDLGCGRGLVCATALVHAPAIRRVIGWDIDEREVRWARHHIGEAVTAVGGRDLITKAEHANFDVGDAREFCAARDVPRSPILAEFLAGDSVGHPSGLQAVESVWIYAFWADWGLKTRQQIATHLFLEDAGFWSVFACSDGALLELIATNLHTGEVDERRLELLKESFERRCAVQVELSGSRRRHSIYFYAKKHF